MTTQINTVIQNVIADAVQTAMYGGTLEIRTGTQPASANDAATGTLLLEYTPLYFSPSSGGVAELDVSGGAPQDNALATGTATWGRLKNGTNVIDGSVGLSGSGAQFIITATGLTAGDLVSLQSASITAPAA